VSGTAGGGGLERLLRPRSVAIVGASADVSRTAGKPLPYLRKHAYSGEITVVNPRYPSIDGVACYPSVGALPSVPDVALVLLGGESAIGAVAELAQLGAGAAIVLAGGFAEIDEDGGQRQSRLRAAAGSMRMLGPNTIGMVNVSDRTALSASVALELDELPLGGVSLVSQSGGMLGALLSRGAAHGLGFSKLVATGNEADVDICDVMEYLLDDPATSVIALYLESVRRPERFKEVAAAAESAGTPLVVFKVGRSEAGAVSATSHTGALAGADRMYDALFRQTGVIRVAAVTELIDVACGLVSGRALRGSRLGILTSTGGAGAVVADACGVFGFSVPVPDAVAEGRLRSALPNAAPAETQRNPVDLTLANIRSETYRETVAALVESPTYDAVVVVVGSSGLGDPKLAAEPVREAAGRTDKPVAVYVSPHALNIVAYLNSVGVPAFHTAEGLAAAFVAMRSRTARLTGLARAHREAEVSRLGDEILEGVTPSVAAGAAADQRETARSVTRAEALRHGRWNEAESLGLFERFGIPAPRYRVATTPADAEAFARSLNVPVVVKVLARELAHKSDVGGVRVGVAPEDVARVCQEIERGLPNTTRTSEGWLIQQQIGREATEMLLGVTRDAQLGLALMLGAGGIATEVFGDTSLRLLPLRSGDAEAMLGELKSRVLLEGFRGRPRGDIAALIQAIEVFAMMAETLGEALLEAEINPLFVLPEGQGVRAADGIVVLG
jgi:acyl-CoA synthetase (NDP forming)